MQRNRLVTIRNSMSDRVNDEDTLLIEESLIDCDFELHSHDFFEIEFVLSGSATQILNGESYEVQKGTLIFLHPYDYHEYIVPKGGNFNRVNISFSMFYADAKTILELLQMPPFVIDVTDESEFDFLAGLLTFAAKEYMASVKHNGPRADYKYSHPFIRSLVECVFKFLFAQRNESKILPVARESNMQKILAYIHSNFRENMTLDDISAFVSLSTQYTCNIFKDALSKTIKQYINELRLAYAAELLKTYDLSVNEICYECGYQTLSHFLREFKKMYGVSPLAYKKQS